MSEKMQAFRKVLRTVACWFGGALVVLFLWAPLWAFISAVVEKVRGLLP